MWYRGSGVVLDCIDSRFLPSFLLSYQGRMIVPLQASDFGTLYIHAYTYKFLHALYLELNYVQHHEHYQYNILRCRIIFRGTY